MEFNRFDICAAYRQLEHDFNIGGMLRERASCRRRGESVSAQLQRIGYKPSPMGDMTENAWDIYHTAAQRMGITG